MKRLIRGNVAMMLVVIVLSSCNTVVSQDAATSFLTAMFTDTNQRSRHRTLDKLSADYVDMAPVLLESDGIANLVKEADVVVHLSEVEYSGKDSALEFFALFEVLHRGQVTGHARVFGNINLDNVGNSWKISNYDMDITELLFQISISQDT